ncbi:MAG: hypothetical protein GTN71_11585, partial [Anaerolineae bacterium]|nr:hypothetical protein [Anaerolineae bacterium]
MIGKVIKDNYKYWKKPQNVLEVKLMKPMKRSVLAISAIALALLAQHYLAERISVVDAILLYAVAAYLTVRAFAGTEAIKEPASASASIEASWTQRTWGALGIACLLLVLSLIWLRSPPPPFFGTLLWLASLVS